MPDACTFIAERPSRGPADGRCRTLEHVGRIVYTMGLSTHPLCAREVMEIENRALKKVQLRLTPALRDS